MRDPHYRRRLIATALGLGVGGSAFLVTLLNLTTDLSRTALGSGFFSSVYELQGRNLLDGRISVPDGSMGIEGFERGGKTWMYYPPFPALLRIPVLMTTEEFDGKLTLVSMALAFVVFAVMVTKLAWLVLARVTGTEDVSRTGAAFTGVFLAGATGGTFLTYDAALPWVYHEVYLWAVAAAVGALYWMIRVLAEPGWHAVRWLGVFAFAAIGTRATEGWAICLTLLGIAVWMRIRPASAAHRSMWWGVLAAAGIPLVLSMALNLYKFDHVFMFPLQDQVWTQLNEHRREALAVNGGDITGPQFFTTSFMAYLQPIGIRFVDYFPFITLPGSPAPAYHGAVIDQAYRTGSVTSFMPLFTLLTMVTVAALVGPWTPKGARILRVPMLAAILVTGGVMGYGYYATRYATEFVPALVLGGAIGTSLVVRLVSRLPRSGRLPVLAVVSIVAVFSILAQVSIGLSAAATSGRGEALLRYLGWQQSVSRDAQAGLVETTDGPPEGGRADDLAIRGDCDVLYLNTGERYEPWIVVQQRDLSVRVHADGDLEPGRIPLFTVMGTARESGDEVLLEVGPDDRLRYVVGNAGGEIASPWVVLPPEGYLQVSLRNLTDLGFYEVTATSIGVLGYLRATHFDDDWTTHPADAEVVESGTAAADLGLRVEETDTLRLPLCGDLADNAGLELGGQ